MRPANREGAVMWAVLAVLGLLVMAGFLLIYTLFGTERANRQQRQQQIEQAIAKDHAGLCAFAAAIPLPASDAPFVQELERRAACPLTTPRPLPTPTVTVVVTPSATPTAPVGVMVAPTPTVKRPAGTGTAPPSFPPPARPTPTPTPTPSPSPACLLGLLCLR